MSILNYHFSFSFFIYWLILFNSGSITQIFNPVAGVLITIGIQTKEVKAEMETHQVIVEITINE